MLKSLYIKNYALIDSLEIDFTSGFSVMTGETGAGKSIILGALGLILGQRADVKSIKHGAEKCVIEGVFDVSAYDLSMFCEERDIEYDAENYIIRREVLSNGKSRAFINDTPATLTDLKELGSRLIDIHSQHQNLLLADDEFQLQALDTLAGTKQMLKVYRELFRQYKKSEKHLAELKELVRKAKEEEDYIRFQYETLLNAALKEGEQVELEAEQEMLAHAEEIKSALYKVFMLLSDDEQGVVRGLKDGLTAMHSLSKVFAKSDGLAERIESAYIDMKDLTSELEKLGGDVEFNPERLQEVNTRLDLIYSLQTKHRVDTILGLVTLTSEFKQKLEDIDSSDQHIDELGKALDAQREKMLASAKELSDKRNKAKAGIEKLLVEKVAFMGMPNVRFECRMSVKETPDMSGIDELIFMFSANKNAQLQPVGNIASGGEISRLMLCLKSMLAGATALPSIIFDEIDTGVSGEIADKMGLIMQDFGQNMQVLAITHLPQIAAKGKTHYKVYKEDDADTTTTHLVQLSDEERLEEVARMLSGSVLTEASIINAKEMLGFK